MWYPGRHVAVEGLLGAFLPFPQIHRLILATAPYPTDSVAISLLL